MENYKPLVSPRINNTANQNAAVHMNHAMLDVTASPPVSKRMRSMETPDAKTAMEATTTATPTQQQQQSVKRKHISNATWTLPTTRSALETLVRAYVMDAGEAPAVLTKRRRRELMNSVNTNARDDDEDVPKKVPPATRGEPDGWENVVVPTWEGVRKRVEEAASRYAPTSTSAAEAEAGAAGVAALPGGGVASTGVPASSAAAVGGDAYSGAAGAADGAAAAAGAAAAGAGAATKPVVKLHKAGKPSKGAGARQYTSKFRGVHQTFPTKRWEAQFRRNGKPTSLGCFDREEEAARAYDKMVVWMELHHIPGVKTGPKGGTTNFPLAEYEADLATLRAMSQDDLVHALRRDGRAQAAAR